VSAGLPWAMLAEETTRPDAANNAAIVVFLSDMLGLLCQLL